MAEQVYNFVRFKGRPLTLEGPFVLSAGLAPSITTCRCSFEEFDPLHATADEPGELTFHFEHPATADVTVKGVRLIHWAPLSFGPPIGGVTRALVYRIALADFRHRFLSPRGGVVRLGLTNPSKGDEPEWKNSDLIQFCLVHMAAAVGVEIPPAVDQFPPPRDLKWFSAHAPTELEKLLDRVGAVVAPRTDGTLRIYMRGEGPDVQGLESRRLPVTSLAKADRRGATVVFSSRPNAVMERSKVSGIADDAWRYVATDPAPADLKELGKWKPLAEIASLGDPLEAIRSDFASVDARYREHFRSQVYRCIQLDPQTHGPSPILKVAKRYVRDQATGQARVSVLPPVLTATLVMQDADGQWANVTHARVEPVGLFEGSVLQFSQAIGKMEESEPTEAWWRTFTPPGEGELVVQFGRELTEEVDGKHRPVYFEIGFQLAEAGGGVVELGADETTLAMDDPQTLVIDRPDWRLYRENNEDVNRAELREQALALAPQYLKGSGDPAELRAAVGFNWIELNGRIAEVRLTQTPPKTEWKVNTWWVPGEAMLLKLRERDRGQRHQAYPGQIATLGERSAEGAPGTTQPAEPIRFPSPPPPAGMGPALVKPTTKLDLGWYEGVVKIAPAAVYTAGQPPTITGAEVACLIVNALEVDRRTNRVQMNHYYPAVEGAPQPAPDRRRTFFMTYDPDDIKDLRFNTAEGQAEGKKWMQVAFTPNPADDEDWTDKVAFTPCPPEATP